MPALRPRERRLLLLAALLGIGVVGYVYVVEPLIEAHAATRELTVARRGLLAPPGAPRHPIGARMAGSSRRCETEIARRRARLLAGDKAPVAASELQKLVKTTAQEAGIEVRSERILAPVDRGGYAEVPVEVTLSGPIRGLTAFLHRLEEAPILLALTDLKVRAPATGATRDLSATIALSGFIPAPPGSDSGTPVPARPPRRGATRRLSPWRGASSSSSTDSSCRGRGLPRSPSVRGLERAPAAWRRRGRPGRRGRAPRRRRRPPRPGPPSRRFAVVAERNLFSPTRTETAAGAAPPHDRSRGRRPRRRRSRGSTASCSCPRDGAGPTWKTSSGVASSRTRWGTSWGTPGSSRSRPDRVVLRRGGETFEVLLYDPAKPRQACRTPRRTIARGWSSGRRPRAGRDGPRRYHAPSPTPGLRAPGRPRPADAASGASTQHGDAGRADRGGMIEKLRAPPDRGPRPRRAGRVRRTRSPRAPRPSPGLQGPRW